MSEADNTGSHQSNHTLTRNFSENPLLTSLPAWPDSVRYQSGCNNMGLEGVQDHIAHHSSKLHPSLSQYLPEHSQSFHPSSHNPPPPPTTNVVHSSARPPGVFSVPEVNMGDSLLTSNTTACNHTCPVRIKPQGCSDIFNRIDMEMFIFWWEISGEIKEAADLNLIKKILFFLW